MRRLIEARQLDDELHRLSIADRAENAFENTLCNQGGGRQMLVTLLVVVDPVAESLRE
jgi:hypothetical protein